MPRCPRFPPLAALPMLLMALPAAQAAGMPDPTVAQAQAAMDRLFEEAIAERPESPTRRLIADAFRPRLLALSGCLPAADAAVPSVDCIGSAQAGPEVVHRLLRFSRVGEAWELQYAQRALPVPVPPLARVQVLLRERFAARLAREQDAGTRQELALAMREAEVFGVQDCAVGDDAPVIECDVSAGAGGERGHQTMAFAWRDGHWVNAPAQ
jgi:hypothetical protein